MAYIANYTDSMTQMYDAKKNTPRIHCRAQMKEIMGKSSERTRRMMNGSRGKKSIVEEFRNFEEYLSFVNGQQKNETKELRKEKSRERRNTSRRLKIEPATQSFKTEQKQKEEVVLPYFQHYRCQIKAPPQRSKSEFRVRRNSFRLNFRIIQENMGKALL